ncbi:hypothetical protein [Tepidibacter hydrothermalis]|uniref:Poly(3-hydroxybutyrate) depolymerase n=1 Tax=Tepidibacter hydrothermalis TaxID=3036126 RepID=A0ABY8EJ74_9FIRM|nr:hypothetical protein [Tepidibacter hydrothermalis]WFD11802.1 hypothetical protein P4S50_06920 [Tepidibacter hydrothermalis]
MKKNLKILGLVGVIVSSFIILAFAEQDAQMDKINSSKKSKIEIKQLTKEERIQMVEESINKLENKYEERLISEETYNAKKMNFNKIIENLKNGKGEFKQLTKEDRIRQLEESVHKLEKKYEEGLISKEKYEEKKTYLNERIENERELNEITIDNINNYKVGMNQVTIDVNGEDRRFKFYVPENLASEGVSLVFRFHGSSNPEGDPTDGITKNYILNKIANDENIIVVYPEGYIEYGSKGWNNTEKNLAFFDEMLKYFEETFDNIDSNRIYTCGHSSGAIFSYALAGFREDKIAAAVPVSGQYCLTKHPEKNTFTDNNVSVPIRAYNGIDDGIVNHEAAYNNMSIWSEKENKGGSSNVEEKSLNIGNYNINVKKWNEGISDLEMYSIKGTGHGISWDTIAQSMWEFMKNHPKNK